MAILHNKLKKIVCSILGTLGIGTLVSCYGMPMNGFYSCIQGTVKDSERNAIPEIQVSVRYNGSERVISTDEDGYYCFEFFSENNRNFTCTLEFKDVDGAANGSFKTKTEVIRFSNEISFQKDVQLEEDN